MSGADRQWDEVTRAIASADTPLEAADLLCQVCVDVFDVDGASISLFFDGTSRGTFGSSDDLSRAIDSIQFTLGEGPCFDVMRDLRPVEAPDLDDPGEQRWPVFAEQALRKGVRAVVALPVSMSASCIGALEFYRGEPGPIGTERLADGLVAAGLAAMPLLDLMTSGNDWDAAQGGGSWDELASLERVEVYQAMGMMMEALDIGSTEALLRLRAYAMSSGETAGQVAVAIVTRRLLLEPGGAFGAGEVASP